jgi:DNA invertase Pin-like site-specific DNA recombinase
LDLQEVSYQDLGVSAYRGANTAEEGSLGVFLDAVEHGDIAKGSYLLVESLDRISRQKPRKAVRVLERICEAGITLVTLSDQRVYTEEVLDDDQTALMVAMMVAMRAHEESRTKGRRVAEAWAKKRLDAADRPLTSICPGWLKLADDRRCFEVREDRAAVVRRVFMETLAGKGQHAIADALNREGVPVFGRGRMWHKSYIAKLLSDRSTIGFYTPHRIEERNGKRIRVPTTAVAGYFPSVVETDIFEQVNTLSSGRGATTTRSHLANILGGLARCPKCDSSMTRVNKGTKGGRPYLICTRAKVGAGCEYRAVRLDAVEESIIGSPATLWATLPSPDAELQERWERLTVNEDVLVDEVERLVTAISEAGHSTALLNKLHETEMALDNTRHNLRELAQRIDETLTNRVSNTLARLTNALEQDESARDLALINATMRQLFDRVVVNYTSGQLELFWRHAPGEASFRTFSWVDL